MDKLRHQVIPRTTCLVFDKSEDRLLLIEFSKEKGALAGFNDPPGGHIEAGEGIIENANREIWEETGIKVNDTKLKGIIHVSNFFGKNIMLFVTLSHTDAGKFKASGEGVPRWVLLKDLKLHKVFEDIKLIISKVKTIGKDEVFTAKSEFDDSGKLLKLKFEQ
jgi:8-oxo-dGTP pyrophosphatase MutT (NUDIX family)